MRWITIRQLKALRKLPVPPEALSDGKRKLLIVMADAPMAARGSRWRAFVWKPAFAAFVIVIFVAVSGAGAVYASQGSLPGDSLYPVKLASERVQERLTLSAERKFTVQATHAAKRLEETQELLERSGLDPKKREALVEKAIDGYEDRLQSLDVIAAKLQQESPKRRKDSKAMQAAERVLDRHVELVASATDGDSDVIQKIVEPIDGSLKLEDKVFSFSRRQSDDGKDEDGTGTEDAWTLHRKERGQRLEGHLQRLKAGLHVKALEIKAGM